MEGGIIYVELTGTNIGYNQEGSRGRGQAQINDLSIFMFPLPGNEDSDLSEIVGTITNYLDETQVNYLYERLFQ